jgi:hypothetical protein
MRYPTTAAIPSNITRKKVTTEEGQEACHIKAKITPSFCSCSARTGRFLTVLSARVQQTFDGCVDRNEKSDVGIAKQQPSEMVWLDATRTP